MRLLLMVGFLFLGSDILAAPPSQEWKAARAEMIRTIDADVRATRHALGHGELDPRVIDALGKVPRHRFVPRDVREFAYANRPLPIGYGQTISQPYIVAIMTDLLQPKPEHRVLEIGTGSGYQAAVLAELVADVYSIEIVKELAGAAKRRLRKLGYENVHTRLGDGYYGWDTKAPFDAIIVTAAASHVPPPLMAQLRIGGKLAIPVGSPFLTQQLLIIEKVAQERFVTRQILPVRFVPLTGRGLED